MRFGNGVDAGLSESVLESIEALDSDLELDAGGTELHRDGAGGGDITERSSLKNLNLLMMKF